MDDSRELLEKLYPYGGKLLQDLQGIFTHMHSVGLHCCDELADAERRIAEYEKAIGELKAKVRGLEDQLQTQSTDHRTELTTREQAINARLSRDYGEREKKLLERIGQLEESLKTEPLELQKKLIEQGDKFAQQLKDYGDYNMKLVHHLEELKKDWQMKVDALQTREQEVEDAEKQLREDRQALENERSTFDSDKTSIEQLKSELATAQKKVSGFDTERRMFKDTIGQLNQTILEYKDQIAKFDGEKSKYETKIENLKRELKVAQKPIEEPKPVEEPIEEPIEETPIEETPIEETPIEPLIEIPKADQDSGDKW